MKLLKGIKDQITVTETVEAQANYGKVEKTDIELTFKKNNSIDDIKKLITDISDGDVDEVEILAKYLVKWDLQYDDGEEVPLDPETIADVYAIGPYRTALSRAFMRVQLNYKEEQSKNS